MNRLVSTWLQLLFCPIHRDKTLILLKPNYYCVTISYKNNPLKHKEDNPLHILLNDQNIQCRLDTSRSPTINTFMSDTFRTWLVQTAWSCHCLFLFFIRLLLREMNKCWSKTQITKLHSLISQHDSNWPGHRYLQRWMKKSASGQAYPLYWLTQLPIWKPWIQGRGEITFYWEQSLQAGPLWRVKNVFLRVSFPCVPLFLPLWMFLPV